MDRNTIRDWQDTLYFGHKQQGFGQDEQLHIERKLMLAAGEIHEAHEELRAGHDFTEVYRNPGSEKPEGFGIEIADAIIRLLNICSACGLDAQTLIAEKHAYNLTRPFRHGKAF